MDLNGQLVFKDPTHLLPFQTHPFDTPSQNQSLEKSPYCNGSESLCEEFNFKIRTKPLNAASTWLGAGTGE